MTRYRPLKTFWEAYAELPAHIQREVRQAFKLFQQGAEDPPFPPSLRIRKMRGYATSLYIASLPLPHAL